MCARGADGWEGLPSPWSHQRLIQSSKTDESMAGSFERFPAHCDCGIDELSGEAQVNGVSKNLRDKSGHCDSFSGYEKIACGSGKNSRVPSAPSSA